MSLPCKANRKNPWELISPRSARRTRSGTGKAFARRTRRMTQKKGCLCFHFCVFPRVLRATLIRPLSKSKILQRKIKCENTTESYKTEILRLCPFASLRFSGAGRGREQRKVAKMPRRKGNCWRHESYPVKPSQSDLIRVLLSITPP
jgi:hypothetical protein